jgi:predicted nucleic acid-binding protein
VLIAALSATGKARDLFLSGLRGEVVLRFSADVLLETERNLARKSPAALPVFAVLRNALAAELVDPSPSLVAEVAQTVEPKDAPIVTGALAAAASYLVTYDQKHLLDRRDEIYTRFGIVVARPDEVLAPDLPSSNP